MLDFFVIFSKGGLVLWYFQSTKDSFIASVNTLVKTVILQERSSVASFDSLNWRLKHRLDNEYDLVFVVGFQKILQLSYVDKLLDDVHREFRDKYANQLTMSNCYQSCFAFDARFGELVAAAEAWSRDQELRPRVMRTFEQSHKSQKTLASMIERRGGSGGGGGGGSGGGGGGEQAAAGGGRRANSAKNKSTKDKSKLNGTNSGVSHGKAANTVSVSPATPSSPAAGGSASSGDGSPVTADDVMAINRRKMAARNKKKGPKSPATSKSSAAAAAAATGGGAGGKKTKSARVWALSGSARDMAQLDFSESAADDQQQQQQQNGTNYTVDSSMVGTMVGNVQDLDVNNSDTDDSDASYDYDDDNDNDDTATAAAAAASAGRSHSGANGSSKKSAGGVLSMFRGLVGSKTLTRDIIEPTLCQLKDHLVAKNVASEIAVKLCDSVAVKLEGRVLGTFDGVARTVRATLVDALTQVLLPRRRVDILRDALQCRRAGRPYTMAFCGVNGVGKSTNLAKICFWLIENGFSVMIAACDTFRAGAVEQLRTHCRHLNALHPAARHAGRTMVQLYEKGYGKDPAGIAGDAISAARDCHTDVVLIDTAGRMQDNEPLMRALAKLVKVNDPDLVLFVGEALVGNEAVDQLVKFDRALADFSTVQQPHTIDGIVLTKFDTIDDKVGAAISMTYVTGQPIVFVGCGQTYRDLRNLNAEAVVSALMK